jgi:hypothetical protein
MKEYVIWGIAPNETEEQILLTKVEGKEIKNIFQAIKIQGILERKHGCTNIRIQEIDLTDGFNNSFIEAIK